MPDAGFAKCSCVNCGTPLEFPVAAAGAQIQCPHCQQTTTLSDPTSQPGDPAELPDAPTGEVHEVGEVDATEARPDGERSLEAAAILAAFSEPIRQPRVSLLYQLGLMVVAVTSVLLPVIYLALAVGAGWAVYFWATHFTFLLSAGGGGRVMVFKFLCYLTPLFAGVVLVFFLFKPMFAQRPRRAQPLALNRNAEPLLFLYVDNLCRAVGCPLPARIDIDCQLNAAAGFRRGALSFFGNDLVLTIGLPLVAGLTLRQFTGVLAHEFGHFAQGYGLRLTYLTRSVNAWLYRVAYERDAWDVLLAEWAETNEWWVALVVGFARLAVWMSRLILRAIMHVGHAISCFMLRQMEYDADAYEIKLVGSEVYETTARRIHILSQLLPTTYRALRTSWNLNRRLPDNFPQMLLRYDADLPAGNRTQWEDTMGLEATGVFDTHPSAGDRIRAARRAAERGVFTLEGPAIALFSNFDVISKQVTILHYADDLGLPMELATLFPLKPPG